MSLQDGTPVEPHGTLPLPGDAVRQIMPAPIVGRASRDVPMQVDQRTGKVQVLIEWDVVDGDGATHQSSTWFNAEDVEILERAPAE